MEILRSFIPVSRNGKLGWYEEFNKHNFLLQQSPAKILLIGDSLISNLGRNPDVWKNYFSIHNTLNFGIPRDIKYSLRRGNINAVDTLLLSKCSKHNLYTFKHQREWLNIDRSLNMSLF